MHTSGLVVTVCNEPGLAEAALTELAAAGPFTLGDSSGNRRAAVLETTAPTEANDWHDWAGALPGIESLEVVFVHWDESEVEVPRAKD